MRPRALCAAVLLSGCTAGSVAVTDGTVPAAPGAPTAAMAAAYARLDIPATAQAGSGAQAAGLSGSQRVRVSPAGNFYGVEVPREEAGDTATSMLREVCLPNVGNPAGAEAAARATGAFPAPTVSTFRSGARFVTFQNKTNGLAVVIVSNASMADTCSVTYAGTNWSIEL